ncbi:MAG TPA: cation transporter, partial [Porphyromonadaceae bacterium]|nr:cation transporter [Porphyromonadaceae bacterium]
RHYPDAVIAFSPPENVFEKIFDTGEAEIVVQLYPKNREEIPDPSSIRKIESVLSGSAGEKAEGVPFEQQFIIIPDKEKLLLYGVSQQEVSRTLKTAFRDNQVAVLRSYQQYLPISISGKQRSIQEVLSKTLIDGYSSGTNQSVQVPLASLVSVMPGEDVKTIIAGKNGEFIPLYYYNVNDPESFMNKTTEIVREE